MFRCEVSELIWDSVLQRLGFNPFCFWTWTSFLEWLAIKDAHVPRLLKRIVAQATLYAIWAERNRRFHDGISRTAPAIFKCIDRMVRDTILGKRKEQRFQQLMQAWLTYD
ncbi:hypothetical protein N665_0009s0099 [Sinapis alba]|nr:hypothetical protein N665_0009s0099 [Sinapis alba]